MCFSMRHKGTSAEEFLEESFTKKEMYKEKRTFFPASGCGCVKVLLGAAVVPCNHESTSMRIKSPALRMTEMKDRNNIVLDNIDGTTRCIVL